MTGAPAGSLYRCTRVHASAWAAVRGAKRQGCNDNGVRQQAACMRGPVCMDVGDARAQAMRKFLLPGRMGSHASCPAIHAPEACSQKLPVRFGQGCRGMLRHTHTHTRTRAHMNVHMHTCTRARKRARMHARKRTRAHTRKHSHARAHPCTGTFDKHTSTCACAGICLRERPCLHSCIRPSAAGCACRSAPRRAGTHTHTNACQQTDTCAHIFTCPRAPVHRHLAQTHKHMCMCRHLSQGTPVPAFMHAPKRSGACMQKCARASKQRRARTRGSIHMRARTHAQAFRTNVQAHVHMHVHVQAFVSGNARACIHAFTQAQRGVHAEVRPQGWQKSAPACMSLHALVCILMQLFVSCCLRHCCC